MQSATLPMQTFRSACRFGRRRSDSELIGWLLVGPRPDGSLLSKDEQRALIDVADPITRAIRNVTRREAREHDIGSGELRPASTSASGASWTEGCSADRGAENSPELIDPPIIQA